MKYDIASKRLADLGIESLVSRFLQIEIEDSKLIEELPQETVTIRSSDFPIRIREKNGNEFIVLLEFQTQWESDLPLRVGEYVLRFKRKYHLLVKPLVLLFRKHHSAVDVYDDGVISVRYRLVRMWEVDGRELLETEDPYLLPLVAVANSGKDEIFEAERRIYSSQSIGSDIVLGGLHRQAIRCDSFEEFENVLERAMS